MYRRSSFDELFDVFRDFDNIFRQTFGDTPAGFTEAGRLIGPGPTGTALQSPFESRRPLRSWGYVPAVESFTKEGQLVIRLELPGVQPTDVNVSLMGNALHVSGEKKATREVDETDVHIREVSRGRFERRFTLPDGIKSEQLKARFENGVLEMTMPLPVQIQPRQIEIEAPATKTIKAA